MDILTDKQVNELFLKVKKNKKFIAILKPEEKIEILDLVERKIENLREFHSRYIEINPHMKDYDINNIHFGNDNYSILLTLKQTLQEEPEQVTINSPHPKYSDKYYAWYHKILMALGKAEQFTPGAKQEIVNYGKRIWNEGRFLSSIYEF